jgi:hypothetical protein
VAFAALAVLAPFFFLGVPSGHDLEFHLNSWMEVVAQWRQGIWYPHWAALAHYGYGEARFIFYPPTSWLLGALLGSMLPWKYVAGAYVWVVLCISGYSMFLLAREWLSRNQAIAAAVFYIVSPYTIVLIYWRSAFAELLAGALIPVLALVIFRASGKSLALALPLSLVIAAVWLTNVPSAVMVNYSAVMLLLAIAFFRRSPGVLAGGAAGIVLGTLLASFYLFPAYYEQRWVDVGEALSEGYRPQDNFLFVATADLSHMQFNHFISVVAVGEIIALVIAGSILFWQIKNKFPEFTVLAIWGGVLSLVMFSVSSIFWHLPELRFMQFPWRWLLCLNVPLAIFIGKAWRSWIPRVIFYLLLLGAIYYASGKAAPPWWEQASDIADMLHSQTRGAGYEGADEYAPASADSSQLKPDAPNVLYEGNGTAQIRVTQWAAERKVIQVTAGQPGKLTLHLFDYPAWRVNLDNKVALAKDGNGGQMQVPIPAGNSDIRIQFGSTWDRRAGEIVTLLTAAFIALLALKRRSIWRMS